MIRHTDWTVRLTDFVKSKKHTPFEWGVNDCCLSFDAHQGSL